MANNPTGKQKGNWDSKTAPRSRGKRGPVRHYYTVKDIARILGKALQTVRNDIGRRVLDIKDIESVARYLQRSKWQRHIVGLKSK